MNWTKTCSEIHFKASKFTTRFQRLKRESGLPIGLNPAAFLTWARRIKAAMGDKEKLGLQYLPPGQDPLHQRPHAQFAGNGQGLVQQRDGFGTVAFRVALTRRVGVVAAGPG